MNKIKFLLTLVILLSVGFIFAQSVAVQFKDVTTPATPLTQTALNPECQAQFGQNYTSTYPIAANRWKFQWYKDGGDNVISPLDNNGNPTGDDILSVGVLSPGNTTGTVQLGPTQCWGPAAASFSASGGVNTYPGDKVFIRIFNAPLIANASKSMCFTALYTITMGGTQAVQPFVPAYAWGPWTTHKIFIPPNPVVCVFPSNGGSGLPYAGVTLTWSYGAKSDPTGYKVYFGTDGGGIATPTNILNGFDNALVTTKATGALLPLTTYYWQIVPYNSAGDLIGCPIWSFTTRDEQIPNPVSYLLPLNNTTIPAEDTFPFDVQLSWTIGAGISPTGYKVYVDDVTPPVHMVSDQVGTTYNVPISAIGDYYWMIVPYIIDNGDKKAMTYPVRATASVMSRALVNNSKCKATGNLIWHFTVTVVPDIPAGTPTEVGGSPATGGVIIDSEVDLYEGPAVTLSDPIFLVLPNTEDLVSPIILSYTGHGIGDLVITVGPGSWYGLIYYSGAWHFANIPDHWPLVVLPGHTATITFLNVDFGAKGDGTILLNDGGNPLPIELSSFNAVLTSQYYVSLTWTTESETSALGFNVRRSETNNVSASQQINIELIQATNTSVQQSYTMTDTNDLEANHTYYYWLESVDMDGSSIAHGPVSATVLEQPTPQLPEISIMKSAYPNPLPLGATTNIEVNIKAGEKGTVTVYNILGQTVKTFNVNQGINKLTWNAKGCASGIYFYKLSTPSLNTTRKLVIVN